VTEANVDVVKAAFDAYIRGDVPRMLAVTAEDIVVTQFPDQVDVRDYHGQEGVMQVMAEWIGTWDDWTIELASARAVGDVVLATAVQRGRGKGSGIPFAEEVTFVFAFRDGLIARWQMFRSEHAALDALGLDGQAANSAVLRP